MLGFADGRGRSPLIEGSVAARRTRNPAAQRTAIGRPEPLVGAARGRSRLGAARQALDGVGGLGWSVLGFVGGAVFWHFIGFWGFVSDVVLAGGSPRPVAERAAILASGPEAKAGAIEVADATSAGACTLLSLDRRTGTTSARPCDTDHAPLPQDAFEGRQDRMLGASDRNARTVHGIESPAKP